MKPFFLLTKKISLRVKILLPLVVISLLTFLVDLKMGWILLGYSFLAYGFVKLAILRPIRLLQMVIDRKESGDNVKEVATPGHDEIDTLAETINVILSQLTDSEEKFRRMVETIRGVFWMTTSDSTKLLYVSPAFEEMWGINPNELYKNPKLRLESILPEDREDVERWFKKGNETPFDVEYRIKRSDGQKIWIHDRGYPVKNEKGETVGIAGISTDISERKRAEEALKESESHNRQLIKELEIANKKALEAARVKGDFLANMSHEIRTPMNGVIGTLELLDGTELTEEQKEYVTTASKSAEFLLEIINDVLDFSKLEAGKMTLQRTIMNLMVVVEDVVEMLALRAEEKGIELALRYSPQAPVMVVGDPARIKQILVNLIGNAVKFTERGHVFVNVECKKVAEDKGEFSIAIEDTGIGIPADRIENIFETFTQVDSSTSRKYSGTGLGLTICRQITRLMDGKIDVQSKIEGGSTFTFSASFPLANRAHVVKESGLLTNLNIAIVDDNECNQKILHELLTAHGNRCQIFSSGQQALGAILQSWQQEDPIHMALIDQKLPFMEGEALGRKIKSDPQMGRTELILMSIIGGAANLQQLKIAGFSGHINKPLRPSQLIKSLGQIWEKHIKPEGSHVPIVKSVISSSQKESSMTIERKESKKLNVDVLLVDDNATNREVASRMLEKLGCRPEMATNGLEALQKVKLFPYGLIFMDCQMPEMDGYQATQEIRNFEKGRNWRIPIVAMTAHALEGDREKCLSFGMDDYISKPVKQDNLAKAIQSWAIHLDRSIVDNLSSLNGDNKNFFSSLTKDFFDNAENTIHQIKSAVSAKDEKKMKSLAHSLRGSSATLGATRLFALCTWLEMTESQTSSDSVGGEKIVSALEQELFFVRQLLKEIDAESSPKGSMDVAA